MCHRHRSVLTQEKQCHGFSNNITSADHNTLLAGNLNTGAFQKLDDPCRGTGHKSRLTDTESPNALRMKTIDILRRIDCTDHRILIDMHRQWKLYQNPVYILSLIQLCDQGKKLLLCSLRRKLIRERLYPNICTCFLFISHIDTGCRIVSNLNHSQTHLYSLFLHPGNLFLQLILYLCGNSLSINNLRHCSILLYPSVKTNR